MNLSKAHTASEREFLLNYKTTARGGWKIAILSRRSFEKWSDEIGK
jgi:hypothetical protein